jgi:hypothetical protein
MYPLTGMCANANGGAGSWGSWDFMDFWDNAFCLLPFAICYPLPITSSHKTF